MKARNYVFTINNYTKKMLSDLEKVSKKLEKHNYIIYGLEKGQKGTKHIQGYIQLKDAQGFKFLQNYFNLKKRNKFVKFHIENAKGSYKQNINYCKKGLQSKKEWEEKKTKGKNYGKNAIVFEFGEVKKQGQRNDLSEIKEFLKEKPNDIFYLVNNTITNNQQLRFAQNIQQYFFKHRDVKTPPKVFWLYGKSGIGKTKLVYDSFGSDDVCSVSSYDWLGTGYKQQKCFLLDDFRKSDIKFNTLLKITDRYPFTLFYKGGSIPLNSEYIIITSSRSIQDIYSDTFGYEQDEELYQLLRRVKQINLEKVKVKDLKKIKL
jgi:hypothetical protein